MPLKEKGKKKRKKKRKYSLETKWGHISELTVLIKKMYKSHTYAMLAFEYILAHTTKYNGIHVTSNYNVLPEYILQSDCT